MRVELLEFLACPLCGAALRFAVPPDGARDVREGALECTGGCGAYPIERGVPRLLPDLCRRSATEVDRQLATQRSFGAQWRLFRYGGTTWGVTVEQRLPVVLYELGWTPDDLPGKTVLDAGCGNGTLSLAMAERGATVVAMDLSDSVFRAQDHCRHERLHFLQGDLLRPPLRRSVFDAIYSCGVFHHTPDTRRCFDALVPSLRSEDDARYFVWLYAPRSFLFNATVEQLMKLTRRLPSFITVPLCIALSPPVEAISRILTAAGFIDHAPRTLRDRAVQLHDLLTPRYVWYHRFDETRTWAERAGFERIERTDYAPDGDVPEHVRACLDRYRTVCRPGFGILCRGPHRAESPAA